jgi:hypothetical protein
VSAVNRRILSCVARPIQDSERPKVATDTIPDDHEFVCLTLGPYIFGTSEDRPAFRLHNAAIYFKSPVALGDHWREMLGSFILDKLYKTELAVVAADAHRKGRASGAVGETVAAFERRAYDALRALLIQGTPFETHVAGLEIRRVFDAGRFREEAMLMRPRTSHPWEGILSIDSHVLETADRVACSLDRIFARTDEFGRLQRGLDHWDRATMEHRLDVRLHALVCAIEALIAPKRGSTQRQFVARCKVIVRAPDADRLLNEIYELRSQVEHSNDWRLAFQQTRSSLSGEDAELLANLRAFQVELIARRAYLRLLLDPTFLESFRSDELIRRFWASVDRVRIWGNPMNIESEVESLFDPHKTEIFEQVMGIDRA